jgi:hypothetical protein
VFDVRVCVLAFIGFAFYSTEIIYEGIILRAAFITFLGILSFYALIRLRESPTSLMLIGCALILSLFFQSRPNTFLCLPFVIFYIHKFVFKDWEPEKRVRGWGVFLIPLFLSFIPLLVQCYLVHGRFVFFDSSGATAFLSGNFIEYPGVGFETNHLYRFQKEHQMENLSPEHFQKSDGVAHNLLKNKRYGGKVFHLMLFLEAVQMICFESHTRILNKISRQKCSSPTGIKKYKPPMNEITLNQ